MSSLFDSLSGGFGKLLAPIVLVVEEPRWLARMLAELGVPPDANNNTLVQALAAVADLKRAIDETRMRVWSSMEAAKSGDPEWVQEFWMQRAAEVCLSMIGHLERGELNPESPRAADLRAAAERLARSFPPRP